MRLFNRPHLKCRSTFVGIASALAYSSVYTVDGGEAAVIFDRYRGVLPKVELEGSHVLIPVIATAFSPHISHANCIHRNSLPWSIVP